MIVEEQKKVLTQAYNKAMHLLANREHSEYELRKKLGVFDSFIVTETMRRLQQQNYQDDRRFASSLLRTRLNAGKGYLWIKHELTQHRLRDEHIQQLLSTIRLEQWQEYCHQVWKKKYTKNHLNDHQDQNDEVDVVGEKKQRAKQKMFLNQRGFRPQDWQEFL